MGNWKELGEVPDSDDDGLDSQEFVSTDEPHHPAPQPSAEQGIRTSHGADDDVWSIPKSPLEHRTTSSRPDSTSKPITQPFAVSARKNQHENGEITPSPHPGQSATTRSDLDIRQGTKMLEGESLSETEDELALPGPPYGNRLSSTQSHAPRTSRRDGTAISSPSRADFRPGRSLRPRKPIQEHPYLLENAQYSSILKSHGIKPIRMATPATRPGDEAGEEDSQEQEFAAEESQVNPERGEDRDSSESQNTAAKETRSTFEDDEGLELLGVVDLSTSPKTSPLHLAAVATSSQDAVTDQTDGTSMSTDDELPSVGDLFKRPHKSRGPPTTKRARLTKPVTAATRSTPTGLQRQRRSSSPMLSLLDNLRASSSPEASPATRQPILPPHQGPHNDRFLIVDEDDPVFGRAGSVSGLSASESESEAEVIRKTGKRMKGVLPASWLRLDRPKPRVGVQTSSHRQSPAQSPEREPRRGLALPKQANPAASTTRLLMDFSDDDSGGDDGEGRDFSPIINSPGYPRAAVSSALSRRRFDEDLSAEEEDIIDRMTTGSKRKTSFQGPRRRKRRKDNHGVHNFTDRTPRQPRITSMLSRSDNAQTLSHEWSSDGVAKSTITRGSRRLPESAKTMKPRMLSILDFIDSGAPQFLRVAARTARKSSRLGKSSPTRKFINLGNRRDNIDAMAVLQDWRSGKLQPGPSSLQSSRIPAKKRTPLRPLSTNSAPRSSVTGVQLLSRSQFQKATKQPRITGFTTSGSDKVSPAEPRKDARNVSYSKARPQAPWRPAQLESTEENLSKHPRFGARKRALDALYRKQKTDAVSLVSGPARQNVADHIPGPPGSRSQAKDQFSPSQHSLEKGIPQRSRFRKRSQPRFVDTKAAHFTHAADPLPFDSTTTAVAEPESRKKQRLAGLGPFGTQYTHHFETFPLEVGVYFHESTLIGSGRLSWATANGSLDRLYLPRGRVTFQLGDQTLRWGVWDDRTSSELGIVVDCMMDSAVATNNSDIPAGPQPLDCADFILDYVQNALSFAGQDSHTSFVTRWLEVLTRLMDRFQSADSLRTEATTPGASVRAQQQLRIFSRLLLIASFALHVCRETSTATTETNRAEDALKRLSQLHMGALLTVGFDPVRSTYNDMQQLSHREHGIRSQNEESTMSWVALMRVLSHARLPRSGFWSIFYSTTATPEVANSHDARDLEGLWEKMFTLLPLGSFDDAGVLVGRGREVGPADGWGMPQQVLKRVFQLYREDSRQSPSFNEYCRALLGRCHYLIDQWGWCRCTGVVGVIFDFFGSQSLAHLRNEEVYKSPRFLDELAGAPSLSVEPEDRCFHIFIKMLGLALLRLRQQGLTNDIRNLISRTLPNHDRQYQKEKIIYQHDLAALRNHHDLLCTLFWAAPSDQRPGVHLIEKLVDPASSHREACLINIRAWSQLARFVVSSGESSGVYQPFMSWQSNVFQKVLDQYLSAASDIQRQFQALTADDSRSISRDMADAMVLKNKAAAMDVLHASVQSSLDVLAHAPTLGAATMCLNTSQLERVFTKLDVSSPKCDWRILLAAIDIVEKYIERLEKALDEQYSLGSSTTDPRHTEDAILMLDHRLARSLFSITRTVISLPSDLMAGQGGLRATCAERAVMISARLCSRFVHAGMARLVRFFGPGEYSVFGLPLAGMGSGQRRYLPLFMATLVKNNIFDFKDIGSSILQIWILSIVKPYAMLRYETYLAEALRDHDVPWVQGAFIPAGALPDYNSCRDFFACAIASMRRSLRESTGTSRQALRSDYAKALSAAMSQMKDDLQSAKADPKSHGHYVAFVREIIALIKSYGGDMCPVDQFFYQLGPYYSPSLEDPQLQTAGVVAYGIRLGEGDVTASPQLFYYLFNNFKMAVSNDRLGEECKILERAMGNDHVLSFVLSRMLPAVIRSVGRADEAWPLLDIYVAALNGLLTRSCLPKELGEENMADVTGLLEAILGWIKAAAAAAAAAAAHHQSSGDNTGLTCAQVHILSQLGALANLLQPSLLSLSYLTAAPPQQRSRLAKAVRDYSDFASVAADHVDEVLTSARQTAGALEVSWLLLARIPDPDGNDGNGSSGRSSISTSTSGGGINAHVDSFARAIVDDVAKNWVVRDGRVAVRKAVVAASAAAAAAGSLAASQVVGGEGVTFESWQIDQALGRLRNETRLWLLGRQERKPRAKRAKGSQRAYGWVY